MARAFEPKPRLALPLAWMMVKRNRDLQPNIMTKIPNIFSLSVFGATLPKPTEMSPVKVK